MTPQNWYSVEQAGLRNISHDFTPDQIALLLVPSMSEEDWNQATLDVVTEMKENMYRGLREFYDHGMTPGVRLSPAKMREKFLLLLLTDHQGDIESAAVEYGWLMRDDYIDQMRAGAAPPPASRPWVQLTGIPIVFGWVQDSFQKVMKDYEQKIQETASVLH